MAMDTCPHCGSPGAFDDAVDGRCPVCGMALPSETEAYDPPENSAEVTATSEPDTSTLRPAELVSGEAATITLEDSSEEDQHDRPKGRDLIRPRKLSPEYANRVSAVWRQTRSQFRDPQETIKSEKSGVFEVGELNIGSRVVGPVEDPGVKDYELTEVIGEGAMGTVWSGRQASLNRDVAIKIPKGAATTSDLGRRQFMSEVVVTGQLDHPNIVPIYDLGKNASGELFYSMKRVEGRPWNALLEEHGLDVQQNVEILMKVCDAIRFAHDRGVIHRDIKPHNVMVGRYGEVSVMDWGIALRLDFDSPHTAITRISPAGTPAYMAPEMATGSSGEIGTVTDVYLLGAVLYEILTGEPPHPPPIDSQNQSEMLTDALLIAARNEITPIDQGGELVEIAYRAMATEVENRFQSVRDFQDAIREALSHAESTNLTERGEKLLQQAKVNGRTAHGRHGGRFDDFDRARFAFEEALQIWNGNRTARTRLDETLLAYAGYAYDEGAYARGIALLSEENAEHKAMLRKLKSARSRTNSLAMLLKAALLLIVIGTSVFSFFLYRARLHEEKAKNAAIASQEAEEKAKNDAIAARNNAIAAQEAEEEAKNKAIAAQEAEEKAKNKAITAQEAEEKAKNDAIAARNNAIEAQKAEEKSKNEAITAQKEAQAASYAFEIALAAEELQRNAFDRTTEILTSQTQSETKRPLRNWEWGHLKALVGFDATTFGDRGKLLQGRVESSAISQNREWVAAGTGDGDVFVWRFDRSEQPVRLRYGDAVSAVAITADGSALLAAGRAEGGSHSVKVWSLPARDGAPPAREFGSQTAAILSLDLSSDSSKVVTAAADGKVELSQFVGEGPTKKFVATSQENSIWCVRFSQDGKWIVTSGEDGAVRVWNAGLIAATDGPVREARRFEGHEGAVYAAAFSPDGRYLVSGGRDRRLLAMRFVADDAGRATYSSAEAVRLRLSDTSGEPQRDDIVLIGEHDAEIRSVSFAADGSVLFSAGHDHTIRVWDMDEGLDQVTLVKTLRGHGGWVRSCVALPNDPDRVLSGGFDRRVRIWNWRKFAFPLVLRHENPRSLGDMPLTAGAASPVGDWVAAASTSGVITLWDMTDPLDPKPQELAEGHDWQATTATYFPDERRLLTAGGDNTVLVWDALRGNELLRMGGWNAPVGSGWRGVATVSSDGKWIATGAADDVLARIWDANSGELIASLKSRNAAASPDGERPEATALAFSPDGTRLLLGDQWGTCYLSTAPSGWGVRPFQAHPSKISAIKFLPDGRGFLTASFDGTVLEWAIQSDSVTPHDTFRHADRVVAMDLSRDGLTMITAAGSDDEQAVLRIWDRSRPEAPTHFMRLSEIGGEHVSSGGKNSLVRSVALHPNEPQALVTVFNPRTSTYRIGRWVWRDSSNPYRLVSDRGLRDVSTALFAPHRKSAMLTVGGRGARLQELGPAATLVSMTYRPQSAIHSISISADGRKLVSASQDRSLKIWALDPQRRLWIPDAKLVGRHDAAINSVAFHPARHDLFVTASDDGTAKIWQDRDGVWTSARILTRPGERAGPVYDAEFVSGLGNAMRVVTAGADGAFLWEEGGVAPRTIDSEGSACCVAPSPGGKWIVVAHGSEATIYDIATLQPVATPLTGHSAEITSVAFTPNGSRLFTTSRDYTVKLWDTQSLVTDPTRANQHRELLTLEGHSDEVTSVTVIAGPKYSFVLTTGLDGQAIVWPSDVPNP